MHRACTVHACMHQKLKISIKFSACTVHAPCMHHAPSTENNLEKSRACTMHRKKKVYKEQENGN